MRKGTKSCLECRRRKIRCDLAPGSTAVCSECYARGSQCIDQERAKNLSSAPASDQAYSLRKRVAHLEGLVQEFLHNDGGANQNLVSSRPAASPDSQTGTQSRMGQSP